MRTLIRLEEGAQFVGCALALYWCDVAWWWYLLLFIGPDISMLGYLAGPRVGAVSYNFFHHKALGAAIIISALALDHVLYLSLPAVLDQQVWLPIGLVLFGHSSMDRMLGYGLKFGDDFQHTHLGWIGKARKQEQGQ